MVALGFLMIGLSVLGLFLLWRNKLFENKLILKILVPSVILPQLALQLGWISAEVGRQPWIVYGLLRTKDAFSKTVSSGEIWFSMILFTLIYILLFILFLFLLDRKIKHGPDEIGQNADIYTDKKTILG
jgi:cytochrome d ubiquinol oxidase subunit I